jgi:hypothetical protein
MIAQRVKIIKTHTGDLSAGDIFLVPVTLGTEVWIRANTVQFRNWKKKDGTYKQVLIVLSNDPDPVMVPVEILEFTNEFAEVR